MSTLAYDCDKKAPILRFLTQTNSSVALLDAFFITFGCNVSVCYLTIALKRRQLWDSRLSFRFVQGLYGFVVRRGKASRRCHYGMHG